MKKICLETLHNIISISNFSLYIFYTIMKKNYIFHDTTSCVSSYQNSSQTPSDTIYKIEMKQKVLMNWATCYPIRRRRKLISAWHNEEEKRIQFFRLSKNNSTHYELFNTIENCLTHKNLKIFQTIRENLGDSLMEIYGRWRESCSTFSSLQLITETRQKFLRTIRMIFTIIFLPLRNA